MGHQEEIERVRSILSFAYISGQDPLSIEQQKFSSPKIFSPMVFSSMAFSPIFSSMVFSLTVFSPMVFSSMVFSPFLQWSSLQWSFIQSRMNSSFTDLSRMFLFALLFSPFLNTIQLRRHSKALCCLWILTYMNQNILYRILLSLNARQNQIQNLRFLSEKTPQLTRTQL